jgi:hypothetical protein
MFKNNERAETKKKEEEWSRLIRTKDGWCCCICGNPYKPNAHHIIPRDVKEFKYDLDNGITLCVKHHKFSRVISAHQNTVGFHMWLKKYRPFQLEVMENKYRDYLKRVEGIIV